MYFDALSFLEDERDAWRPFEALLDMADADFETPVEAAHGWSARELASHLASSHEYALDVARDLAIGEQSPAYQAMKAAWDERGDAVNDELSAAWGALPVGEVRRRARELPGELRGYLTVVPEARWVKHESLRAILRGGASRPLRRPRGRSPGDHGRGGMIEGTLDEILVETVEDVDGVTVRAASGAREVVAAGILVAVLAPDAVELRLRPAVAEAAMRTPDVAASSRGRGWVRFAPPTVDGFALDRAAAWLESAVRLALESAVGLAVEDQDTT